MKFLVLLSLIGLVKCRYLAEEYSPLDYGDDAYELSRQLRSQVTVFVDR